MNALRSAVTCHRFESGDVSPHSLKVPSVTGIPAGGFVQAAQTEMSVSRNLPRVVQGCVTKIPILSAMSGEELGHHILHLSVQSGVQLDCGLR